MVVCFGGANQTLHGGEHPIHSIVSFRRQLGQSLFRVLVVTNRQFQIHRHRLKAFVNVHSYQFTGTPVPRVKTSMPSFFSLDANSFGVPVSTGNVP